MTMFSENLYLYTILYFAAMTGLSLYGMHRIWLLICWHQERKKILPGTVCHLPEKMTHFPFVTIQLPLFNERFVAERLIDASALIDWPRDRFEIQILDDSDDDTGEIVDERVNYWSQKGIDVKVLRRGERTGYKAGALHYGLQRALGEYIAIFDADFVPPAEFLQKTIPHFCTDCIGMVQARWDFLNKDQSWLTRIQSILLGAHFHIEHWVRFKRGLYFNFNGTAGIWKKEAIVSSGGWEDDTVTEDLDLSYRAQLKGWKFVYLADLCVPSELPSTIASFRSQQQRWAKGSIQTARKILPRIIRSNISRRVKIEAGFHLLSNLGWFCGMIITLTLVPAIILRTEIGPYQMLRIDLPLFIGTTCMLTFFFLVYACHYEGKRSIAYVVLLPFFSIAVAPSIALSVMKGIFSWGGPFERTPKFGIDGVQKFPRQSLAYLNNTSSHLFLTCSLLLYSLIPFSYALHRGTWFALPFLALFPAGFLMVILKELSEMNIRTR